MSNNYDYLLPNLAQGGRPASRERLPFDVIVFCAEEAQPDVARGIEAIRLRLHDHGEPPTRAHLASALAASKMVVKRLKAGKRVLVTCHMGWNRSGLVSGLTLRRLGMPAERTIQTIRKARGPNALGNKYFERILRIL